MEAVTGPNGRTFFIRPDGRKQDEDGFVSSSKTPGQKKGPWFCVGVRITDEGVGVRDTKDPNKTTLNFSREEWSRFIAGVKDGEFDV